MLLLSVIEDTICNRRYAPLSLSLSPPTTRPAPRSLFICFERYGPTTHPLPLPSHPPHTSPRESMGWGCCKPFASRNENLFSKTKTSHSILLLAKLSQCLPKGRPNRLARPDTLTDIVKAGLATTEGRGDSQLSTFRIRHRISRHVGTSENRSFLTSGLSHWAAFSGLSVTPVFRGRVSMTER